MLSTGNLLEVYPMMEAQAVKKEKRIMVVEDDININRLVSYNLSKNGFITESVYDGFEAQERLSREVFDVVVLDIMLPSIDGFRICKTVKENPAAFNTFVVILTARAESQDMVYGNMVGADYYITKPFSVNKLINIIKELTVMRDKKYSVLLHSSIGRSWSEGGN
ncbi:MAG: response regulator [Candidatus Omnitrophica bacterium]|nr:response regulator [Candidatus Omnitrophota bacterium]